MLRTTFETCRLNECVDRNQHRRNAAFGRYHRLESTGEHDTTGWRSRPPVRDTRTTTRLLMGLHDLRDEAVWEEFDRRYRPIVLGVARRVGLPDQDAADVAQDTIIRFVKAYREGKYDRSRGRLRSWIVGIARFRIADAYKDKARRDAWRGESYIDALPGEREFEDLWQTERRRTILREALERLPEVTRTDAKTIEAFKLLTHARIPAADVAAQLEMTLDDVYQAKNRVTQRLRGITRELELLYDEEETR